MATVLSYSTARSGGNRAFPYLPLILGTAATYGGILLLAAWVSAAIDHFHEIQGQHVLYGTPRWPYYQRWGGDVQFSIGLAWVVVTTTLSTIFLFRRRASTWLCVGHVLWNLLAIPLMSFAFASIGFDNGLYP